MVSQTVNFENGQIQYVLATKEPEQSVSDRVRELMDKGMTVEQNE